MAGGARAPFLPDAVVAEIAGRLMEGPDRQAGLLALVALCGVSRQWRATGRRVAPGVALAVDGLEGATRCSLGRPVTAHEARFRALGPPAKAAAFQAALRLLGGYTRVAFAGEGVTDFVLLEAARRQGPHLSHAELKVGPFLPAAFPRCIACPGYARITSAFG